MSETGDVHIQRDHDFGADPVCVRNLSPARIPSLKLSETEAKVLTAWNDCQIGFGFGFSHAAKMSGVEPHKIRRAVRALARKGALSFEKVLFDECEGTMLGAGYVLTDLGHEHLQTMEPSA